MSLQSFNRGLRQKVENKWHETDKESPIWQFVSILTRPNAVFKHIITHKHETNLWYRGNLKFCLTELLILIFSIIIWFIFRIVPASFKSFLYASVSYVLFDFGILCLIISTLFWKCINKWRIITHSYRESRQDVELKYAVDAFHNGMAAFIFDFIACYPLLSIIPKITKSQILEYFIPNILFCIALCHGMYIMVSSFNVLAFVKRMNPLYFIAPLVLVCILMIAMKVNFAQFWISIHFK